MRKGLVLAVCATAVMATGARAQTYQVPSAYAIPLPPVLEPRFELGMRYWQSVGKTNFSINSSKQDPELGNPTSTLTYDGMNGYSGEIFWYARNETNTFAKGFVGGGALNGGSLDDEDFFAGQVKFSDTFSQLKGESLLYGTIDVGQHFTLSDGPSKLSFSPFIGYNYWQETAAAYGVRCNSDDVDGAFCGSPGDVVVPFSTEVIKNKAMWSALRLGGEVKAKLWNRLTLTGEAAILPVTYVVDEDSHLLRTDLGRPPNGEDRGIGWGYQLEAALRYDITPGWSAGAGVRYWFAEVDGTSEFVHLDVKVPMDHYTSERFGVFGDVSYRF